MPIVRRCGHPRRETVSSLLLLHAQSRGSCLEQTESFWAFSPVRKNFAGSSSGDYAYAWIGRLFKQQWDFPPAPASTSVLSGLMARCFLVPVAGEGAQYACLPVDHTAAKTLKDHPQFAYSFIQAIVEASLRWINWAIGAEPAEFNSEGGGKTGEQTPKGAPKRIPRRRRVIYPQKSWRTITGCRWMRDFHGASLAAGKIIMQWDGLKAPTPAQTNQNSFTIQPPLPLLLRDLKAKAKRRDKKTGQRPPTTRMQGGGLHSPHEDQRHITSAITADHLATLAASLGGDSIEVRILRAELERCLYAKGGAAWPLTQRFHPRCCSREKRTCRVYCRFPARGSAG